MAKRKQTTKTRRNTEPALLPVEEAETPGENQSQPDEPLPGGAEAPEDDVKIYDVGTEPEAELIPESMIFVATEDEKPEPIDGTFDDPNDAVEWVNIAVPMYRGKITNYDVNMQASLDTKEQREGWQRMHLGLAAVAKAQLNGAVVPIHRQHTKVDSARWLFQALANAGEELC